MWKIMIGIGIGIYIGTYYECKPIISKIVKVANENIPPQKDDETK